MAKQETKQKSWALRLIEGLEEATREAKKNEKATPRYWNGDDWGSMDGIRDAGNWLDRQRTEFVEKFVQENKTEIFGAKGKA